jgi:hypothetical protein
MKHKLNALGLATLAVLALGALSASAARGDGRFRAEYYPAVVDGTATSMNLWHIGARTTGCHESSYLRSLGSATSTLEIQPAYAGCSTNFGWIDKISTNGCTYKWAISQVTAPGTATGTQTIACPAGKEIEIHRYNGPGGSLICHYAIPPQGPNNGITYSNQAPGKSWPEESVEAEIAVSGMQATVVGGSSIACGASSGKTVNVGQTVTLNLVALTAGMPIGFSIGDPGIYLAGEASGEAAKQPRFESETGSEPVAVEGSQDAPYSHEVNLQIRRFACESVTFSGELVGASTELPLDAKYENCVGNGGTATVVSMRSCHYVVNVLNVGPPYAGSLDLECSAEGDGMEVRFWAFGVQPEPGKELCIIRVPEQAGLGSVGLETLGTGFDRQIAMDFAITGMRYQRILGTAVNCGAADSTKASYTGSTTLRGR